MKSTLFLALTAFFSLSAMANNAPSKQLIPNETELAAVPIGAELVFQKDQVFEPRQATVCPKAFASCCLFDTDFKTRSDKTSRRTVQAKKPLKLVKISEEFFDVGPRPGLQVVLHLETTSGNSVQASCPMQIADNGQNVIKLSTTVQHFRKQFGENFSFKAAPYFRIDEASASVEQPLPEAPVEIIL